LCGAFVDEWKEYKLAVPTYGAIILNTFMDKVLLVQGFWAKASWGFPKGKVNEDEPPDQCGVREVMEETGFDISSYLEEDEWLEQNINDHTVRLYLIPGVSENTKFKTETRCEIKDIRWFDINSLPTNKTDLSCKAKLGLAPNSFFMVVPFLRDLKQWVKLKQADSQERQSRVLWALSPSSCVSAPSTAKSVSFSKLPSRLPSSASRVPHLPRSRPLTSARPSLPTPSRTTN